jgi:alkylation response protein AidB-like acyl-CoA dehydrogenase
MLAGWRPPPARPRRAASAAALEVTKGCIQLHGGIGYTDECAIGLYLKKCHGLAPPGWATAAWHRRRYNDLAGEPAAMRPTPELVVGGEQPIRCADEVAAPGLADNFPPGVAVSRRSRHEPEATRASGTSSSTRSGWAAPNWPKSNTAAWAWAPYEQVALQSEFDRHGVQIAPNMARGDARPADHLLRHRSAEARDTCRASCPAKCAGARAIPSPRPGSDLANLQHLGGGSTATTSSSTARRSGPRSRTRPHMVFLLVRTDPQAKKQEGISFLLADMRSPGITVKPHPQPQRRLRVLRSLLRRRARAASANLVGGLNQGWTMAKSLLGSERIMIGNPRWRKRAPLLRLRELAEVANGLARRRRLLRARHDELRLDVDDLDALFVRCVDVLRRGRDLGPEVSMLKIWVTETHAARGRPDARDRRRERRQRPVAGLGRRRAAPGQRLLLGAAGQHLRRQQRDPAQHPGQGRA